MKQQFKTEFASFDVIDEYKLYTYNVYKKFLFFWHPVFCYSDPDKNVCISECEKYIQEHTN